MASSQPTAILKRRSGSSTTVPAWVSLSSASPGAKAMYDLVKLFAETFAATGTPEPYTAQEMLAEALGRTQGAVSGYTKELRELGAIETKQQKIAGGSLIYTVFEDPPENYAGATTMVEFLVRYAAKKAAKADDGRTSVDPKPSTNDAPTPTRRSPANDAPTNDSIVASSAPTIVASTVGSNDGAANGATVRPTTAPTTVANDDEKWLPSLTRLLVDAEELGMGIEDPSFHRKMGPRLLGMLKDSWPEAELRKLITTNLGGFDTKIAGAMTHLADSARRGWWGTVASVPRQQGERCRKGPGHEIYPTDNCMACRIDEKEEAGLIGSSAYYAPPTRG